MAKLFKIKKVAPNDYSNDMLPHTRKEVFFDVFKLHWAKFVTLGTIFFLFSLPSHFVSIATTLLVSKQMQEAKLLEGEEYLKALYEIYGTKNAAAFIQVVCILIIGVAMAGLIRIIRQYAWEENVDFGSDFIKGIKENIGQTLLLSLFVGLIYAICSYNYHTSAVATDKMYSIILLLPTFFFVLVGIPVVSYAIVCISIYKCNFFSMLKTCFIIFSKSILKTWGIIICLLAPYAILLIPNMIVLIIARIVLSMITPFVIFIWYLFSFNQLDLYFNEEHHKELVGKGTN